MRANCGSLHNKYIDVHPTTQLLDVVSDPSAPDGFVFAKNYDEDEVNIRVVDGSRTWIQTALTPAIVDFVDPDNYIEGRIYLHNRSGGDDFEWLETGVDPRGNYWPAPRWTDSAFHGGFPVCYRGRIYQAALLIRQFKDGTPTIIASGILPPGSWTEEGAITNGYSDVEPELTGQFEGNSFLTLSVLPHSEKTNGELRGRVVLTLLTERTRPQTDEYFVTYWPAGITAYNVILNSPAGLAGICRASYRPPDDDCGYEVRKSDFVAFSGEYAFKFPDDPSWLSRRKEWYKPIARLNCITDELFIVPYSAKGEGDAIAQSHQNIYEDSPTSLISEITQSRNGNLVRSYEDAPQAFYDQNKWQFVDDLGSYDDLLKPPYNPQGGSINSITAGDASGVGFTGVLARGLLGYKDALSNYRQAFSLIAGPSTSNCASWSTEDEPPPDRLVVSTTLNDQSFSQPYYYSSWLPDRLEFLKLNGAMDCAYAAEIRWTNPHRDFRQYDGMIGQLTDTLRVNGYLFIVFSSPQSPYLYFDDVSGIWKQSKAKALMADVFVGLRLHFTEDGGSNQIYSYLQGWLSASNNSAFYDGFRGDQKLQLYNQGLSPETGVIAVMPRGDYLRGWQKYSATRNPDGSWTTSKTVSNAVAQYFRYMAPLNMNYVSEH